MNLNDIIGAMEDAGASAEVILIAVRAIAELIVSLSCVSPRPNRPMNNPLCVPPLWLGKGSAEGTISRIQGGRLMEGTSQVL